MTVRLLEKATQLLRLKRGLRADVNKKSADLTGLEGEPAYTTDDKSFWIHDGTEYVLQGNLSHAVTFEDIVVVNEGEIVWLV